MILSTRTTCFLLGKDGVPHELIQHYFCGILGDVFETKTPGSAINSIWFLGCIERIIVREEPNPLSQVLISYLNSRAGELSIKRVCA